MVHITIDGKLILTIESYDQPCTMVRHVLWYWFYVFPLNDVFYVYYRDDEFEDYFEDMFL